MPPGDQWFIKDKQFIKVLQEYELKQSLGTKGARGYAVWREISDRVKHPEAYCRSKWYSMKYNYLIIKKMINSGRVTEDSVRRNAKTKRYLDGTLDFLDRNVSLIPISEIPVSSHRFFNSAFELSAKTELEPTSILPDIVNDETILSLGMDQAVSEVYQIKDNSADIEVVDSGLSTNIQINKSDDLYGMKNYEMNKEDPLGNVETNTDHTHTPATTGDRLRKILMSSKNDTSNPTETDSDDGYLYNFLVKYQNSTTETEKDCDLQQYMKDLADVACRRLTPGTRKYFLSKVDLIVSEILEGN